MLQFQRSASVLGNVGFLALVGFGALVLIGPVVAVISVVVSVALALVSAVLPFALIGLLIWLPIRSWCLHKPVDWEGARNTVQGIWHGAVRFVRFFTIDLLRGTIRLAGAIRQKAGQLGTTTLAAVCEVVGGAAVAYGLAWLATMPHEPNPHILIGSLLVGGCLGALVGNSRREQVAKAVTVENDVRDAVGAV